MAWGNNESSVFTSNFSLFAEGGVSIFPKNNHCLKIPCLTVARRDQKSQGKAILSTEPPPAEMGSSYYKLYKKVLTLLLFLKNSQSPSFQCTSILKTTTSTASSITSNSSLKPHFKDNRIAYSCGVVPGNSSSTNDFATYKKRNALNFFC